jgi:hypothetical protein
VLEIPEGEVLDCETAVLSVPVLLALVLEVPEEDAVVLPVAD